MLTAGLDQGTSTYDVVVLSEDQKDAKVVNERSFSTLYVKAHPEAALGAVSSVEGKVDSAVLPSGFGVPLKTIEALTESDVFEMSLKKTEAEKSSLLRVIDVFRRSGITCYLTPAVRHLSTVPRVKKVNRIDMGTSDKVCSVALAVYSQVKKSGIKPRDSSFVLVELGSAFNSYVLVDGGEIVDGVGGSNCWLGMGARGSIDGEVAALSGYFTKEDAYSGGALFLASAGAAGITPEELAAYAQSGSEPATLAAEAYIEGVMRDVGSLLCSAEVKPKEAFVSGRVSKIEYFTTKLGQRFSKSRFTSEMSLSHMNLLGSSAKEAALGAALIANGLAGGSFSDIVDSLKLRDASGSVLSDVILGARAGKTYSALKA
ncbi:MAG: DUF1464 family protein [Thermoprotei archaeon]